MTAFSLLNISKLATVVKGDPKAPFFNSYYTKVEGRVLLFPWIAPLFP